MSREFPPARLPPLAFAAHGIQITISYEDPQFVPQPRRAKTFAPLPGGKCEARYECRLWGETQRCVCVIGRRQGCHTPHGAVIAKGKRQAAAVDSRASLSIAAKAAELMETRAVAVRIHISEINFQPPHTKRAMIRRTKRLAVNSSRPGCAVGGKSKPSSEARVASVDALSTPEVRGALSARQARVAVWAMLFASGTRPPRTIKRY